AGSWLQLERALDVGGFARQPLRSVRGLAGWQHQNRALQNREQLSGPLFPQRADYLHVIRDAESPRYPSIGVDMKQRATDSFDARIDVRTVIARHPPMEIGPRDSVDVGRSQPRLGLSPGPALARRRCSAIDQDHARGAVCL